MPIYTHNQYSSVHQYPEQDGTTGFKAKNKLMEPFGVLTSLGGTEVKTGLSLCRCFIPPGTTTIHATIMLQQPSECLIVARLGRPVEKDYSAYVRNLPVTTYLKLTTSGFTEAQLRSADCVGRNSSGFLNIAKGPCPTGGWLYMQILRKSGGGPTNGIFGTDVRTVDYMSWYNQAVWDASGDPVESNQTVPTITQPVQPAQTPTVPTTTNTQSVGIILTQTQWEGIKNGGTLTIKVS